MTTHSIFEVFSEQNATGVAYKNKALKRGIIRYLDQTGNSTITDLALALNISVPKTTSLINELMADGIIGDYGKIESTGGRRASLYGLVAENCYFIGVDVKHDYINIGLLDFKKNLISNKMQVPYHLENTRGSLRELLMAVRNFISEQTIDQKTVLAVCFNLPGRINTQSGHSYNYFHFNEEPLSVTIEKELGIRTFLENDSRAMAYGEFHDGIVKNEKNVLFVNLDYGIGLGIMVDGRVYYGKSGFGGEFGHIPVFNNEIICHCGKKGCLETEASGLALLRAFRESIAAGSSSGVMKKSKNPDDILLADIMDAIRQEDVLSLELIAAVGEKIGRGLAVLINIFNPELVILGGTMADTGDYIRLPIQSALNKYSLSLVNNDTQVKLSKLGEKAGLMGGCLIARNNLLTAMSQPQHQGMYII